MVPRQAFDDMGKVLFDLAFGDAEHLGQLVRGEPGSGQQLDHALADRAFGRQHRGMVSENGRKR